MQRVFNVGANCVSYPNVYEDTNNIRTLYFTDANTQQIYKYHLPKDFTDFIVFRYEKESNVGDLKPEVAADRQSISIDGEKLPRLPLTKEMVDMKHQLSAMYQRAVPEQQYLHCNPAYNVFEENGIVIDSYKEIGKKDEGIFKLKSSAQADEAILKLNRKQYEYNNEEIIYQYQKIEPEIIIKLNYTMQNTSIFTFNCSDD